MKQMTTKELTLLGKDLKTAKIIVLNKHGFSVSEISSIMGISEVIVKNLITNAENVCNK